MKTENAQIYLTSSAQEEDGIEERGDRTYVQGERNCSHELREKNREIKRE